MEKLRAEILVSGKVQGVFYRAHALEFARELGLTGTICNLSTGNVEIIAEGSENLLKEFYLWCQDGPKMAEVKNVQIHYTAGKDEFTTFKRK
jgi:acylphosphatase